jgi:hypothetical protein
MRCLPASCFWTDSWTRTTATTGSGCRRRRSYHPARAWAWELRLQDEIGQDFRIQESPYRGDGGATAHRTAHLDEHWQDALATIAKEVQRRRRKHKAPQPELTLLETGLWSRHRAEGWHLEMEQTRVQEAEFRLRAPDEAAARTVFEADHPDLVGIRKALVEGFNRADSPPQLPLDASESGP